MGSLSTNSTTKKINDFNHTSIFATLLHPAADLSKTKNIIDVCRYLLYAFPSEGNSEPTPDFGHFFNYIRQPVGIMILLSIWSDNSSYASSNLDSS